MAYNVTISGGSGTSRIPNGSYTVTTTTSGYDNSTISPSSVNIVDGTNEYAFTIAATGTLTLHVSEDGTSSGTPIVGATFYRTDSAGTTYGDVVTTDSSGNAVLNNVPYASSSSPAIYYKQASSDGSHEYSTTVASTTMTTSTETVEITNTLAATRTITLTDTNYANLPIETSTITIE